MKMEQLIQTASDNKSILYAVVDIMGIPREVEVHPCGCVMVFNDHINGTDYMGYWKHCPACRLQLEGWIILKGENALTHHEKRSTLSL